MNKIWKKILYRINPNNLFPGSKDYWEKRYHEGGNSGAGSYNRLAVFKADFLNEFVLKNQVSSVIEFGCGDGNQLKLAKYPRYTGLDVSSKAIDLCTELFKSDKTKSFYHYDTLNFQEGQQAYHADVSLSLDVIYHLVENEVFEAYMKNLFKSAERFVIIYSSNFDGEHRYHERDRKFTTWVDKNITGWEISEVVKNKYPEDRNNPEETSKADFYIYKKIK